MRFMLRARRLIFFVIDHCRQRDALLWTLVVHRLLFENIVHGWIILSNRDWSLSLLVINLFIMNSNFNILVDQIILQVRLIISAVKFIHPWVPWSMRMRTFTWANSLVVRVERTSYHTLSKSRWRVLRIVIIYIVGLSLLFVFIVFAIDYCFINVDFVWILVMNIKS